MIDFRRRVLAEYTGTAGLVAVIVGSGIAAESLSADAGIRLLANSLATALGLGVLILVLAPVSGAHFNPLVSVADWATGRGRGTGLRPAGLGAYVTAQVLGAVSGTVVANAMFDRSAVRIATADRVTGGRLLGEIVATAGLITVVLALARSGRAALSAAAVGAYIGAAYWFTSSTGFANPAVTAGRVFTDTFTGIAPGSALAFIAAQCAGAALGSALALALFPRPVAAHESPSPTTDSRPI